MIENKKKYNTKILNLSLGTPANNPLKSDPLVRAVDEAVKAGITVVVAAGNSGPNSQTILSPGNSPSAITVGAVNDRADKSDSTYSVAPFSSRGPTREGLRKPDVVAPGVSIKSLSNSTEGYKTLSGTSMATPVVSGTLAVLLSKNEALSTRELKSHIMNSCNSLNEKPDNQGAGIISIEKLFSSDSKVENPTRSKFSRPSRYKRPVSSRPNRPTPVLPPSGSKTYDIKKQDYMADGLVFLLFLILILIRVI